jgi:hypothetical protein
LPWRWHVEDRREHLAVLASLDARGVAPRPRLAGSVQVIATPRRAIKTAPPQLPAVEPVDLDEVLRDG